MLKLNWENMQTKIEIPAEIIDSITRALERTLEVEEFIDNAEISLSFVDDESIRELNNSTRGKESPTDVLSFPLYDFTLEDPEEVSDGFPVSLGDIVISLERAAEQAKEIGHSTVEEVAFLAVHSTLHLLGYDHELSPEDEEAQCAAQRVIIDKLDL